MHKSLITLVSAASIGGIMVTVAGTANAGCYGCAVGAGILGGVAAGAIVGSAIATPCEARTIVRDTPVDVVEETSYPFRGTVRMSVNPETALAFPLLLRIPAWAAETRIKVNGQAQLTPSPGTFARIERTWKAGDRVDVEFPLEPRVSQWFHDSVAVERGALVFSYGIGRRLVEA